MTYDLVVIGGGPAGTSAAITAARNGARVLLVDRGRFPRQKVCGEFVSAEALELLARLLDKETSFVLQDGIRISKARLFIDGKVLQATVAPAAASIARLDLDAALWNAANRAGVETYQQTAVQKIEGTGPFTVTFKNGQLRARAVVDATGRWSNLNAVHAETAHTKEKWLGLKAHFHAPSLVSSVDLYFSNNSYCGVQPVRVAGTDCYALNVCAMVRADVASTLHEAIGLHPGLKESSQEWQMIGDAVSTSPLIFRKPRPLDKEVLRVGDAACFVDPFVGDGISLALRSGALAAECLLPFFRGGLFREAADWYAECYRRNFARIFRTSSRVRRLFRFPQMVRKPVVFLFAKRPALTQFLVSKTR